MWATPGCSGALWAYTECTWSFEIGLTLASWLNIAISYLKISSAHFWESRSEDLEFSLHDQQQTLISIDILLW